MVLRFFMGTLATEQISQNIYLTNNKQSFNADVKGRLDVILFESGIFISRAKAKKNIKAGLIEVEGKIISKPSCIVLKGQSIIITKKNSDSFESAFNCNDRYDLKVLYEDEDLAVINKPKGLVVHTGPGHLNDNLVTILKARFLKLSGVGGLLRQGIVHRLDKNTSGVLIVAKTDLAHVELSKLFKRRQVHKEYLAIVWGLFDVKAGKLSGQMARSPFNRLKFTTRCSNGASRETTTMFCVEESFCDFSLVRLMPITGRTHQLRVQLSEIGHPIVGDSLYGGKKRINKKTCPKEILDAFLGIDGQFLHAEKISFVHPSTSYPVAVKADLPWDFALFLNLIRQYA